MQPEEYEKLGSYALIGLPTELYEKRWVSVVSLNPQCSVSARHMLPSGQIIVELFTAMLRSPRWLEKCVHWQVCGGWTDEDRVPNSDWWAELWVWLL